MKKYVIFAVLALSANAFAASEFNSAALPCAESVKKDMGNESNERYQQEKSEIEERINRARAINSQANGLDRAMDCIERLKKVSVSGNMGIPNILDAILNGIGSLVCSQVDAVMGQANAKINQSIQVPGIKGLPGSSGSGGVYVGSSGNNTVNVNGSNVYSAPTPSVSQFQTATPKPQTPVVPAQQPGVMDRFTNAIRNVF